MRRIISITALLLTVCLLMPLLSPVDVSASVPARRTLAIGLLYGTTALPSSNLINAEGGGYEFGFFDSSLTFYPVAWTAESRISVMVDRNLQWNAAGSFSGQYDLAVDNGLGQPAPDVPYVGFAHIPLASHGTFDEAVAVAGGYPDGFVRFILGNEAPYVSMYGNYTSSDAARAATGSETVNTGGTRTITVSVLGTSRIIFEFDNSANPGLIFGVRPLGSERPSTYFRGERYYGAFRYERRTEAAITVANIINLEDYVQGVVPYEMSAGWPVEALRAQAICARTYALASLNKHHSAHGFDLCNTVDCQVYRGVAASNANTDYAVISTAGQVVTYDGALASTFYCSSHGGSSENNENIWSGTPLPYLRAVVDNYEDAIASSISNYNWMLTISQAEITERVRAAGYPGASAIATIQVSQYSPTGNVISVVATDTNGVGYTFSRRTALISLFGSGLRSVRFNIANVQTWTPGDPIYVNDPAQAVQLYEFSVITDSGISTVNTQMTAIDGSGNIVNILGGAGLAAGSPTGPVDGNFYLVGKGWGHNIGMSQWGAYSMAHYYGMTAEQIITHYFTGVTITQA